MPWSLPRLFHSLFARRQERKLGCVTVHHGVLLAVAFMAVSATCTEPLSAQTSNPPYGFVYTGGASPSTGINEYAIDPTTGALTVAASSPFSAGGNVLDLAPHPSGNFLYALITNASRNSVVAFSIDGQTGALTQVPGSPYDAGPVSTEGGPAPSMLAVTPSGKFLYAGNHENRQLQGFAIDGTTGALTPISLAGAAGDVLAMSPGGSYLYTYTELGQTIVYSVDSSSGTLSQVQTTSNCPGVRPAIDPGGRFYFAGGTSIAACTIGASTGMLNPVSGSPFATDYGVENLAIHPAGAFVYAVGESYAGSVGTFHILAFVDAITGALTPMQYSPFALPTNSRYPEGIAAEPRGKYLYVTDANQGVIAYTTDSTTGDLSLVSNSAIGPAAASIAVVEPIASSTPTPVSLSISPSSETVVTRTLGNQLQFALSATFSDGSTHFLTSSASWASSNTSIGTVAAGLVTAKGFGTVIVTASYGALSTSARVEIDQAALQTISLSPSTPTVHAGNAIPFSATGTYQDGSTADLTKLVSWQSSASAVASIDSTGLATAYAEGTTTITASAGGISRSATLNVVAAASRSNQFGHFVYTGALGYPFCCQGPTTISGYSVNGATGALTRIPLSPFAAGGGVDGMAVHPSGNFLYATVSKGSTRTVSEFTIDAVTGALSPAPGVAPPAYGYGTFIRITPNGKFLYTAGSAYISGFSIDSATGALSPISQPSVRGTAIVINPAGTYLYASDSNTMVYSINQSTGVLTQVQYMSGVVCHQLAIDSTGKHLYCLFQGIQAWQIDAASGKLTQVKGSPFAAAKFFWNLSLDPSGSFLYAVVGETSSGKPVYGFAIDPSTGALTAMQHSPFSLPVAPGSYTYTYDVTVEPHGRYLYALELNNGVTSYAVNPTTGELTLVGKSFTPAGGDTIVSSGSSQLWDPQLQWFTPQPIIYGTQLGVSQLDATASVPGTFTYSPAAGAILGAGNQTLGVSFTPDDSAEFYSESASVILTVLKATPSITWTPPAPIPYGTALSATQLNATASLPGKFSYSPAAGTVLTAGLHTLTATFTPDDTTNYKVATSTVTLAVNQVTPTITWATPSPITYGTALSSTQLDAAASVPGSFSYSPSAGTILTAGSSLLTATFTPTDTTDYTTARATVQIVVNPAVPAAMTSPAPGGTLTGSSAGFTWTAGSGVSQYLLHVGTTSAGSYNVANTGALHTTSTTITGIPTTGGTLYVRLYSLIAGAWQYKDYSYTEYVPPAPAVITSPTPGRTLTGSSATFAWTAGAGVKQYSLHIGTTGVGSMNVATSGALTTLSYTVSNIPTAGGTLYVRLYSLINGAWQYNDYTYTEQ